ncbi:MAG: hypothetical protein HQM09_06710 [Candidatus Riflebacteria bacterium]|nr:hypothetical protein [Candidatus Riflebacteria bacterium]
MKRKIAGWHLAVTVAISSLAPGVVFPVSVRIHAEESSAKQDAKLLFDEALQLKKAGKFEEAAKSFEMAIRKDRTILGEDDNGLINILRDLYQKRLASTPEDITVLEAMGFITAVCDSNFSKAIEYYQKVEKLTQKEQVRNRTASLIERLKAQAEVSQQSQAEISGKAREERLVSWSEMEKQDALAAQSEAVAARDAKMAEMYRSREEKEARIPQIEDELKALEEENERNHRMYLTTNDRRYKRKESTGDIEFEDKKREIEKLRSEITKLTDDIAKASKEDPGQKGAKAASHGAGGEGPAEPGVEPGTASETPDASATGSSSGTESDTETATGTGTGTITDTNIDTKTDTATAGTAIPGKSINTGTGTGADAANPGAKGPGQVATPTANTDTGASSSTRIPSESPPPGLPANHPDFPQEPVSEGNKLVGSGSEADALTVLDTSSGTRVEKGSASASTTVSSGSNSLIP